MAQLSVDWSYFRPGQAIYCDRMVVGLGRRAKPRGDGDRRSQERRCSWFLLSVGHGRIIRIRQAQAPGRDPLGTSPAHRIRCACGSAYEFEEIPMRTAAEVTP